MRNLVVHMQTGYCGSDAWDILQVSEGYSDEDIDQMAWEMAVENYQMYGFDGPELDEDEEYEESYDTVSYSWYDYEPELHDMYRSGGGSFQEEFDRG